MKNSIIIALAVLLVPSLALAAKCELYNTPKLFLEDSYELYEGEIFQLDINSTVIDDRTKFTFKNINSSYSTFAIYENGFLDLIPNQANVGIHKILIIGYADNDCLDSRLVTFKVHDRPSLEVTPETGELLTEESKGTTFKANSYDTDTFADDLKYEWYLDEELVARGRTYNFFPGYDDSGLYDLRVKVTDHTNLSDEKEWNLVVRNVNRPPIQFVAIPNADLPTNYSATLYDLTQYFIDPDGDELHFSFSELLYEYDEEVPKTEIAIDLANSVVTVQTSFKPGFKFLVFTARDEYNLSTNSNKVRLSTFVKADSAGSFCGDGFCSQAETCNYCLADCGPCEPTCNSNWECSNWGPCQPSGIKTRVCVDTNNCAVPYNKPAEAENCQYVASCDDGILNQDEDRIDCGGECPACPTCDDGIPNQGETGIDCGGPCKACASCEDNVKNQDETDIDCGGSCENCGPGLSCQNNFDCQSFICQDFVCTIPTCFDVVRNQGEEKTDCGGPCAACPTCTDQTQNQGELGIDCGGPCNACPSCDDKIKNQNERLIDCGGVCRACGFKDYFGFLEFKYFFLMLVMVMVSLVFVIKRINARGYRSRFSWIEKENNLGLVMGLNRFLRITRLRRHKLDHMDAGKEALNVLNSAKNRDKIAATLQQYFTRILPIPKDATYDQIYGAVKDCGAPRLVRGMLAVLLRKLWVLTSESVVINEQMNDIREESIKIILELTKDI